MSDVDDETKIRSNVATFAFRDQGRWTDLRALFRPEATIAVTWYAGPVDGFVERSMKMAQAPSAPVTKHWIGASRVALAGNRALCDTDVIIMARGRIGPIEVDMASYARFLDRFEQRDGAWRVLARTAIYEKDRIDPVAPSLLFPLIYRAARFERYPRSYRHLAAGLVRSGIGLVPGIIESGTQEEQNLITAGPDLAGGTARGVSASSPGIGAPVASSLHR
jgi:hypothetical protein